MNNIIHFDNIDVNTLSDEFLAEIEKYMLKCLHEKLDQEEDIPIFEAKKHATSEVAKKYNLTLEKTKKVVSEIQLRNLDRDLGIK